MVMQNIVELRNIHKYYTMGSVVVKALSGLSLKIRQGEFVAIVGSSGSGKSTAMHIMGCLDIPTKGKVLFEGHDVSKFEADELAAIRGSKIGFVFQMFNLLPNATAIENVMLPVTFTNHGNGTREKAMQILKELEIGERAKHRPSELSGGQQQRIAIARALINDPKLILADEPTGNLDSQTGTRIMDYLRRINREKGKTIIVVTHDSELAKQADRIIKIKDGKTE